LEWTRGWLNEKGVDQPRLSAELLLAHALGCSKIDLYVRFEEEPTAEQIAQFRELVKEAATLKPIAQLIGLKEFYSLEFEVSAEVLIPRPETEALVTRAVELAKAAEQQPYRVLEIGTGCGCIAVAIAHYVPEAEIVATDVSPAALSVAARNIERHGVGGRVALLEADGLDLPPEAVPIGGFDLAASNPPYVSEAEEHLLAENVRRHEPHVALFAGPDGLRFYEMFAAGLSSLLRPRGTVLVEIAAGMEDAVAGVFSRADTWERAGAHKNPCDPHVRVLEFRRRGG
jgi:release factor glutamine methyltransferase